MPIFDRGFLLQKIYRKILHKYYANDLWLDLRLAAKKETVAYVMEHMKEARVLDDRFALLSFALGKAPKEGLYMEFGVMKGKTARFIAGRTSNTVHGFDSFEGLPSDWKGGREGAGKFSTGGKLPHVPSNVTLHKGWFDATLPEFLKTTQEKVAFLHVDCDIYESTKTVFDVLADRIVPGTVIVFDEYFNYVNWQQHEIKAFKEFIKAHKRSYEYIGFAAEQGHVAVRITG